MLSKVRIAPRLLGLVALAVLAIVLVGGVGLFATSSVYTDLQRSRAEAQRPIERFAEINELMREALQQLYAATLHHPDLPAAEAPEAVGGGADDRDGRRGEQRLHGPRVQADPVYPLPRMGVAGSETSRQSMRSAPGRFQALVPEDRRRLLRVQRMPARDRLRREDLCR